MGQVKVETRGLVAVAWYQGTAHQQYQDRYRLLCRGIPMVDAAQRGEVFAIADGLGDAQRATQAAQLLCDRLIDLMRPSVIPDASAHALLELVRRVHGEILDWGRDTRGLPLGAASATVLWLSANRAIVVQAGDTLPLIVRDGRAIPLSQRRRSVSGLHHCLGASDLELALEGSDVHEGDRIVLATNGVTTRLGDQRIASITDKSADTEAAAEALVRAALGDGGADVTAIVVEVMFA